MQQLIAGITILAVNDKRSISYLSKWTHYSGFMSIPKEIGGDKWATLLSTLHMIFIISFALIIVFWCVTLYQQKAVIVY